MVYTKNGKFTHERKFSHEPPDAKLPLTSQGICNPCLPGKHQQDMQKTECEKCELNTFANLLNQSLCFQCPAGFRSPNTSISYQIYLVNMYNLV